MSITYRAERPADYRETESVTREAFWNQYCPGCCEHFLLHLMRTHPDFLPELDLVAVDGDRIVGNVVFARSALLGDNGQAYEVLTLGPVSVLPSHQRQGVGGALIRCAGALAREMSFRAIFLCGDPDYYARHGFLPAEQFGIRNGENLYAAALQVCPLYENALSGITGRYVESAAYQVDVAAAEEFDRAFPAWEKRSDTPTQRRFLELVSMKSRP